ncbi:MAG: damage-control phosphatase ARMT1 family protein [Chloroflexota bacterium]
MKTALDCIPCLLRQTLEAARLVSADPAVHEQAVREYLRSAAALDLDQSPPAIAQHIHRRLRQMTGIEDPYRAAKARQNQASMALLPALRAEIRSSASPLMTAVRIAIAANRIDMGVHGDIADDDVQQAVRCALTEPFFGEQNAFCQALAEARSILYLADNSGEIAFDRLLIEQIGPSRITLAVRGAPVLNDATRADARTVGLDEMVEVIDNGSDAPGTLLEDCSPEFRRRFFAADLILAKGQGNFESLSHQPAKLFFLFKAKCAMVADHVGQPVGTQVLVRSKAAQKQSVGYRA